MTDQSPDRLNSDTERVTSSSRPRPSVLVVSRCSTPLGQSVGGADLIALKHAEILDRTGFDTTFIGLTRALASGRAGGLRYVSQKSSGLDSARPDTPSGGPPHFASIFVAIARAALRGRAMSTWKRFGVVIVHASVGAVLFRSTLWRGPMIYCLHDSLYEDRRGRPFAARLFRVLNNHVLEKVAIKLADHVICPSDVVASQLRRSGVSESKISVIYPSAQFGSDSEIEGGVSIGHTGGSDDTSRLTILSVGQQLGRKRFDLLIEALVCLPATVDLILVGNGPKHLEYRRLASRLGVSDRVRFLTEVDGPGLKSLYASSTLFVLVSENEGFPLTVIEALKVGCPVILACPTAPTNWDGFGGSFRVLTEIPRSTELSGLISSTLETVSRLTLSDRQEIVMKAESILPSSGAIGTIYEGLINRLMVTRS